MQVLRLRPPRATFAQDDGEEENRSLLRVSVGSPGAGRVEETARDGRIGVDAAVAKKGPVAARIFEKPKIDLAHDDLFLFMRGLGEDASEGIGEKAAAPELQAGTFCAIAEN